MTSTLTLAERLRALSDDALEDLIATRGLARSRPNDFFDLADALLEPIAIQRGLAPLTRAELAVLAAVLDSDVAVDADHVADTLSGWGAPDAARDDISAALDALSHAFLLEPTPTGLVPYPPVVSRFSSWLDGECLTPQKLAVAGGPAALATVPDIDRRFIDRLAAEHGFAAVGAVAEFVYELERAPARELQKGGLALPDGRRIAAALGIDTADVPTVHWLADHAGLVAREGPVWLPTDLAEEWAVSSTAHRWRALATTWLAEVPADIRPLMLERAHASWGEALRGVARWRYPAADASLDRRVSDLEARAEFLGITGGSAPSSAGIALLESGGDAAAQVMTAAFPAEIDQVYVQNDLSIVAPGPLTPAVDARLRVLADVEATGLAATFRVSPSSLHRAISTGETAQSLRQLILSLSLTGLPQPVDYLIGEAAARYGRVRVRGDDNGGVVYSSDDALLQSIAVDQSLSALRLRNDSSFSATATDAAGALTSRLPLDVVYWALVDAHYPVVAEDESGASLKVRRRLRHVETREPDDGATDLVVRLREADDATGPDASLAWLSRQLESAVRARTTVAVTVALPDGREQVYTLEPTGIGGGRLRGRDRTTDIERTLPVSSIRTISPL